MDCLGEGRSSRNADWKARNNGYRRDLALVVSSAGTWRLAGAARRPGVLGHQGVPGNQGCLGKRRNLRLDESPAQIQNQKSQIGRASPALCPRLRGGVVGPIKQMQRYL